MKGTADDSLTRTGARVLVDHLALNNVRNVFAVAGESYLAVLDALIDRPEIRLITCRQEGGAAFMAEAEGKLTGRPGVAFVTRGPGACNAAIGVHTAMQDSTPMILFIGQVALEQEGREAFQEIDYRAMFAPIAKWVAQINDAARIPELVSRAFHVAISGRPGPVVLALPEDMLTQVVSVGDASPMCKVQPAPAPGDVERLFALLSGAQRPVVIVGGYYDDQSAASLRQFVEAWQLPVITSFRRQDTLDNDSQPYAGDLGTSADPALRQRLRQADLLLVIGARLGEITTQGYQQFKPGNPGPVLIHAHPSAEEIARVFHPTLGLQTAPGPLLDWLAKRTPPARPLAWADWSRDLRQLHLAWRTAPGHTQHALDLWEVFAWLARRLPQDAIITTDAGNFSGWSHRFLSYRRPGRQLGPTSGAMGYGIPAAIAASLIHPGRLVVANVGDGGALMTGQELATAMHHGAHPIILVFNNGMYGTIRMHQEQTYPARVSGTGLTNPDFALWAESFGAFAATVRRTEEFSAAFEAATVAGRVALIELQTDPEQITTRTTITRIRETASGTNPSKSGDAPPPPKTATPR